MASTLEEERGEVWASILESLRLPPDPDRETACRDLLRHLVDSGRRPPAAYRFTLTASSKMFCGS